MCSTTSHILNHKIFIFTLFEAEKREDALFKRLKVIYKK